MGSRLFHSQKCVLEDKYHIALEWVDSCWSPVYILECGISICFVFFFYHIIWNFLECNQNLSCCKFYSNKKMFLCPETSSDLYLDWGQFIFWLKQISKYLTKQYPWCRLAFVSMFASYLGAYVYHVLVTFNLFEWVFYLILICLREELV